MIIFTILLLLPVFFIFIFLNTKQRSQNGNNHLPPGPLGLPIIGNLHQLGRLPHVSLRNMSKRYGPVMFLRLGHLPTVIVSSSEAAKEVLKTHDLKTCSRPRLTGPGKFTDNNIDVSFSPYGHYWRVVRKICVLELFSMKRVQSFRFIREEEVGMLMESIKKSASASIAVDISEKMFTLTANITCRVAFGKSFRKRGFSDDSGRFEEIIHEAFALLGSFCAADFFPYVGWIIDRLTRMHARLEKNFQELDNFFQQIIYDHTQSRKDSEYDDIVDSLLNFARNQTESSAFSIKPNNIKAVIMDIFLAGVDTSALTLVWAMAELARNPRVMKEVKEEIRAIVGSKGKVTETDIDHFTYMKMVIKETLRLHPPATLLLPRETMAEIDINGYRINPKTMIQINAWAIARDPKTWERPEEFFPERFVDNTIDFNGQNYEFLPFGSGRRSCPGVNMGMATVELALANLLYCFDWKLLGNMKEEDVDMDEVAGLTTSKKTPLLLLPVKYQPASSN